MSETVIDVEHLGKRYHLGETHRGLLSARLLGRGRRLVGAVAPDPPETFWALRDVSFSVQPGQLLGLVGPNGAGKSTLLKMLANITYPTEGRIEMRGRVGTLLEVGTGFHPELTGRENVFLAGTILGMKRREIGARYSDIVEFSGVERFIETPVKRYSSGMAVRLGFAVAAHLMPEILLVDEVLAVGDVDFQKRCLEKMTEIVERGTTIVFVSHNMANVQQLCDSALLIADGTIAAAGTPDEIAERYLSSEYSDEQSSARSSHAATVEVPASAHRTGSGEAHLVGAAITSSTGPGADALRLGDGLAFDLTYEVETPLQDVSFEVGIASLDGQQILTAQSIDGAEPAVSLEPGRWRVRLESDAVMLPGTFVLNAAMHRLSGTTVDHVLDVLRFSVANDPVVPGDEYRWHTVRGAVRPAARWAIAPIAG